MCTKQHVGVTNALHTKSDKWGGENQCGQHSTAMLLKQYTHITNGEGGGTQCIVQLSTSVLLTHYTQSTASGRKLIMYNTARWYY